MWRLGYRLLLCFSSSVPDAIEMWHFIIISKNWTASYIGSVVVVDDLVAVSASGGSSVSCVLAFRPLSKEKYADVFDYLDKEGVNQTLLRIKSHLGVQFKRTPKIRANYLRKDRDVEDNC